jgi:hypothetical protein
MIRTTIGKMLTAKVAVVAAVVVGMGGVALAATAGGFSGSDKSAEPRASQPAKEGAPANSKPPHGGPTGLPSSGNFAAMCRDIVDRLQQQRRDLFDDPAFKELLGKDSELWDALAKDLSGGRDLSALDGMCDRITAAVPSARASSAGSNSAGDVAARCRKVLEDVRARQADMLNLPEIRDMSGQDEAFADAVEKAVKEAIEKAIKDAMSADHLDDICDRVAAGAGGPGKPS